MGRSSYRKLGCAEETLVQFLLVFIFLLLRRPLFTLTTSNFMRAFKTAARYYTHRMGIYCHWRHKLPTRFVFSRTTAWFVFSHIFHNEKVNTKIIGRSGKTNNNNSILNKVPSKARTKRFIDQWARLNKHTHSNSRSQEQVSEYGSKKLKSESGS